MPYQEKTFNLPTMDGLSKDAVDQHLGLYAGYVKNFNAITAAIKDLMQDSEKNQHAISELVRRQSFEFDGMRLHEYYFQQLEGGPTPLSTDGKLAAAVKEKWGTDIITLLKNVGLMRGPGWAILYYDAFGGQLHVGFSGEQHQGHFVTLPIVLALDVWEHAYALDYGVQGKGKYIDAFFNNLNWSVVEGRFTALSSWKPN
jgi:Fe-Mn family superoxide dismutase